LNISLEIDDNMKVIKLTESDLTNIVKRVIKESDVKDSLIDMIKYDGWRSVTDMVGGIENLKKVVGIESPMDFVHLFDDLDIFQSEKETDWELYRYEKGKNMMIHNKQDNTVHINHHVIWSFLREGFGLDYNEIQEVMKEWLSEAYNLSRVTPASLTGSYFISLS